MERRLIAAQTLCSAHTPGSRLGLHSSRLSPRRELENCAEGSAKTRASEHSLVNEVGSFMKSTEEQAKTGMITFVAAIFALALIIAGAYFVFWTPTEPEGQPAPHAIDQSK